MITLPAQTTNRFYNTPIKSRVRRTHAPHEPGFREGGTGKYTIINKRGRTIKLNATIENKEFGFDIHLKTENGHVVGSIWMDNVFGWSNYHRMLDSHKGHNLGKLMMRLTEQEVKRRGGKEIQIVSNQQSTITTALSIGYKLTPISEQRIRHLFQIPKEEPTPTPRQIADRLKQTQHKEFPQLKVVREIK